MCFYHHLVDLRRRGSARFGITREFAYADSFEH